jgi:hypothetical protein
MVANPGLSDAGTVGSARFPLKTDPRRVEPRRSQGCLPSLSSRDRRKAWHPAASRFQDRTADGHVFEHVEQLHPGRGWQAGNRCAFPQSQTCAYHPVQVTKAEPGEIKLIDPDFDGAGHASQSGLTPGIGRCLSPHAVLSQGISERPCLRDPGLFGACPFLFYAGELPRPAASLSSCPRRARRTER